GRIIHRAELWSAHGAESRFFVVIIWQSFIVHGARGLGIERERKLLIPIEFVAGITESIIAVLRAGAMPRDIRRVCGDLVRDNSVLHIFVVWKPEMLLWRDVAKHRRAMPPDHSRANRGRNMVISGSYIGHQRPQRVKRRFVTHLLFFIYLLFDLVDWDVPRTFDHCLHVVFPGFLRKLAQSLQFRKLGFVAGIGDASRTQTVAQRKADIVLRKNFADVIESLIQKILFVMMGHPLRQNGAAAAYNS